MEVMNLVFAILGHVLASMLYMARRITSAGTSPKAVVDRSSILDRKEEIRGLWEKKMMASDQSVDHLKDEEKEEAEKKPVKEAQNGDIKKIPNGTVTKGDVDLCVKSKDINENIEETNNSNNDLLDLNSTDEIKLSTPSPIDVSSVKVCEQEDKLIEIMSEPSDERSGQNIEGNDEALVETEVVEVREQVYTATHEQTVVTTVTKETSVVEERKVLVTEQETVYREDTQEDFEEIERRIEAEEFLAAEVVKMQNPPAIEDTEFGDNEEKELEISTIQDNKEVDIDDAPDTVDSPDSLETIEIPDGSNDFEHYTILDPNSKVDGSVNGDGTHESLYSGGNSYVSEESLTLANGEKITTNDEAEEKTFDDHFVLDTHETISPVGEEDKRDSTGKKLRIHTLGVQKTEQPYSTCTTETKIAMEIREMREREEELKIMRERQAQLSPPPPPLPQQQQKKASAPTKIFPVQKAAPQAPYVIANNQKPIATPGYRVSSVFGSRGISQPVKDESKCNKNFNKETAVEKEIRLAKDREEELRKEKGLPPREDDSYVKPSQVKSSQAKAFGKMANAENSRQIATAKIQHEIQEQTMREMALRESGHIQTLSSERTDAKVTKLKTLELASPECTSPTFYNGNGYSNGLFSNGHMSPDSIASKRSTPSPTGSNYSQYSMTRNVVSPNNNNNKNISMQKFIASRGKETTFSASRTSGPFTPKTEFLDNSVRPIPEPGKLKRTASVESKIQQEILDMKLREEELKSLHGSKGTTNGNGYDISTSASPIDYHQNGEGEEAEEMCPRRSNLIAQWEQRIQKSEGKV